MRVRTILCSEARKLRLCPPKAHVNMWTTDGIHLVIHHLSLLAYHPRRSRLDNSIKGLLGIQKVLKTDKRTCSRHATGPAPSERIVPEVIHPVQYGIAPKRCSYRTRTMRFSLVLSKTSRPYEMDILFGRCPTQLQRWNATLRVKGVPNESTAMLVIDGTFSPAKILFRQQRAQPFTRALKSTLQANDTLLRSRKRSSTSNTSASRITFTLPILLVVLSCPTRTLFTRTSKSIHDT